MTHRLTLDPSITRFDFECAASARAWRLHHVVEPDEGHPYEEIWVTDTRGTAVHYIEDHIIAVAYVLVAGDDEDHLAAQLRGDLDTVEPVAAAGRARSASSNAERLRGISYLASSSPPVAEPGLVTAFDRLLADPDAEIRLGAVVATAYPAWPQLDALLERVRNSDPEPRLRDAATQTLSAIRRHRDAGGA